MNKPAASSPSLPIWWIVIAAVAVAVGLVLGERFFATPAPPKLENAVLYKAPRAIPAFELEQASGKPLTLDDWRGHWNVVFFGYTHCPDVCPTTLATFKQANLGLAKRELAGRVRFDFISVDPQRDTPDHLANYVAQFDPDFVAATGSDEQLTVLTRSLGMFYARTTNANGNIEVDHSSSALIVDPRGRLIGMFRPPFKAAEIVADMTTLNATGN